MNQVYSHRRRVLTNLAIALVLGSIAALMFAMLLAMGGGSASLKASAGAALVSLALIIGGGLFAAQATESLANRLGPTGRRLGFLALAVLFCAAWTLPAYVAFHEGARIRCHIHEAQRPELDALTALLGDTPDGVPVFVPSRPHGLTPPPAYLDALELEWVEHPKSVRYELEGFVVSHRVEARPGQALAWGPPRIEIGRHDEDSLTAAWGSPLSSNHYRWLGERVVADFDFDTDTCGPNAAVELRYARSPLEAIGSSPARPLADFEGPLLGRTLAELELTPHRRRPDEGRERVVVMIDGPLTRGRLYGEKDDFVLELELLVDGDERVLGWRIELANKYEAAAMVEALSEQLGPAVRDPNLPDDAETILRLHARDRPELRWTVLGSLTVEAGEKF